MIAFAKTSVCSSFQSEQSRDSSVFVHIDPFRRRRFRQSGHGHDVAGQNNHKSCPRRNPYRFHRHRKALRGTQLCGIVRKAVLCFGKTNRAGTKAHLGQLLQLLFSRRRNYRSNTAVYFPDYSLDFLLKRKCAFIGKGETLLSALVFTETNHLFRKLFSACSPFGPDL